MLTLNLDSYVASTELLPVTVDLLIVLSILQLNYHGARNSNSERESTCKL
jgi:hypothetical protein